MLAANFSTRSSFIHSLYLALIAFFCWFWTTNPVLANYNLSLTALLVVTYFISRFLITDAKNPKGRLPELLIFTAIIFIMLAETGGLSSPFFFATYFLLFAASLLFTSITTVTLTLCTIIFFSTSVNSLNSAVQLVSLLFITPLAIYFGKQYIEVLEDQQLIKRLVTNKQKLLIDQENTAFDILLWLKLEFKTNLVKIIHLSTDLLSEISKLDYRQKERLQSINESAKTLLKSADKLEKEFEQPKV